MEGKIVIGDMPIEEVPVRIRELERRLAELEKWRDDFCRSEQSRAPQNIL